MSKKIKQKVLLQNESYDEGANLHGGATANTVPRPVLHGGAKDVTLLYETEEEITGQVKSRVPLDYQMERYGLHKSALFVSGIEELRVGNEVIDLNQDSPNKQVTPRVVNKVSNFKDYSNQAQKLEQIKNSRNSSKPKPPERREPVDLGEKPVGLGEKPDPSVGTGARSLENLDVGRMADNSNDVE